MTQSWPEAYRAVTLRAWHSNRARVAELSTVVSAWRHARVLTPESRRRMRDLAHALHGSAGTFGHGAASAAADELERLLAGTDTEVTLDHVAGLVGRIEESLGEQPDSEPEP